ncbi:uncharacterized protein METZ01_LOCUS449660, partial [marine metagenome]
MIRIDPEAEDFKKRMPDYVQRVESY